MKQFVENYHIDAILGEVEWERALPQTIIIDIHWQTASSSSYQGVIEQLQTKIAQQTCHKLHELADFLIDDLMVFTCAESMQLQIKKTLSQPLHNYVGVIVNRERQA